MENNRNLEWLFGVTDKDYKELIEKQASTETTASDKNNPKVKVIQKSYQKNFNKRPREKKN